MIAESPNLIRVEGQAHSMGVCIIGPDEVEAGVDVIEHRYMHEQSQTPTPEPGAFPRLRVKARGTQCRFVVVMYPFDRPPAQLQSTETETEYGVNLDWGKEVHTLTFKYEPTAGESSWNFTGTSVER